MCSFRDGQVRLSRYIITNSTLPTLVNRDSTSDVENNCYDNQRPIVGDKLKAINGHFDGKLKQVGQKDMNLNNETYRN